MRLMPPSTSRATVKAAPRLCRWASESTSHQPTAWITGLPPSMAPRRVSSVSRSEESRIVICVPRSLKWTSWRRVAGAGKRNAISASLKSRLGFGVGASQADAIRIRPSTARAAKMNCTGSTPAPRPGRPLPEKFRKKKNQK